MSVRKRTWKTRKNETKGAWIVDYNVNGSRHIETFSRKKDADEREAQVTVDVSKGIHVATSKSVTVAEAGKKWLSDAGGRSTMQRRKNGPGPKLGADNPQAPAITGFDRVANLDQMPAELSRILGNGPASIYWTFLRAEKLRRRPARWNGSVAPIRFLCGPLRLT